MWRGVLLGMLLVLPASVTAQRNLVVAGESRVALVIGNGAYKDSPLANPVNDATDIANALSQYGFKVILKRNAGTREMRQAIREFGTELRRAQVGLFYFAGHGVQLKGENYLVPVGADIQNEAEAEDLAINTGLALRTMEESQVKVSIVILDACRNNPFARSFRSSARGLAQMNAATGSVIAFATAPGSVAADGAGRNGTYTKHLLASLSQPDTDVLKVFQRTRAAVVKETGGRQTPWESTSLIGDFYFAGAPATAPAPAAHVRAQFFAGEERDLGVAPTSTPKRSPFHAPTPREIPGGKVITTVELKQLLDSRSDVVVVDVLDAKDSRVTISGAAAMPGAGHAPFYGAEKSRFAAAMEQLTGGNKGRTVVFLCQNPECWLSYNAALYAIEAGYTSVLWFRGGIDAWRGAGYRTQRVSVSRW